MRTAMIGLFVAVLVTAAWAADAPQTVYQKGRALYDEAQALQRENKFAEAKAKYLEVVDQYPKHELADNALLMAAGMAVRLNDVQGALALYERLIKEMPTSPLVLSALWEQASLYMNRVRDYAKAGLLYERCATEFPGYLSAEQAFWQAVLSYRNAGDHKSVLRVTERFMETKPTAGSYLLQMLPYRLEAYLALDNLKGAADALDLMVRLAPGDRITAAYRLRLADVMRQKKDLKGALDLYLKAAECAGYEGAQRGLLSAADVAVALDPPDVERAVTIYRTYLERYSNGDYAHDVYFRLAMLYRNVAKDREKEIAAHREFIEKVPRSVYLDRAIWHLARACEETKKPEEAEKAYALLLEKCPESEYVPQALFYWAAILAAKGEHARARQLYERVVKDYAGFSVADTAAERLAKLPR